MFKVIFHTLLLFPILLTAQNDLYYTAFENDIIKVDGLTNESELLFGTTSLSDIEYDSGNEELFYTSRTEGRIYKYSLVSKNWKLCSPDWTLLVQF